MGWEIVLSVLLVAVAILVGTVKIYKKIRKAGEDGVYTEDEIEDIIDTVEDTVDDAKEKWENK